MTSVTHYDTRALNALKALCAALISMSRGEIPVELLAGSRLFLPIFIFHIIFFSSYYKEVLFNG